jgi:hypothetical protein
MSNETNIASTNNNSYSTEDISSIIAKVREQQQQLSDLQQQLSVKDEKLNAALVEKKKEMQAYMEGIKNYMGTMKDKLSEAEVAQFLHGLEKCAEAGERNPIFEVMCCASAMHTDNLNKAETTRKENEELKKHLQGGVFGNESARVGTKRGADEICGSQCADFWTDFERSMCNSNIQ